jgi:type VI secretion system protein
MPRCVLALCLALTVLNALTGCGVSKGLVHRATRAAHVSSGKLTLNVKISDSLNQNSPVAVDVLLIRDKNFLKAVQGMSASDWFAKKAQLLRQNPKAMEPVKSWEWVPGQNLGPIDFVVPVDVQAAMIFVNYATGGPHSAPLPTSGKVTIVLDDEDFTVNP